LYLSSELYEGEVLKLKKILIILSAILTFVFGGFTVSAEGTGNDDDNQKSVEIGEKELYENLDMGEAENIEEYTKNENDKDGLNVTLDYEPII
jgi:hypothetical protein